MRMVRMVWMREQHEARFAVHGSMVLHPTYGVNGVVGGQRSSHCDHRESNKINKRTNKEEAKALTDGIHIVVELYFVSSRERP